MAEEAVVEEIEEVTEVAESKWPESWRQDYAGEDADKLEKLGRYASPNAAFDGLFAANQKIVSGEYKRAAEFPEKGTDEEKSAWRTAQGIPEAPDKYDLGEVDENLKASVAQRAFESNLPPQVAKTFVDWHTEQLEAEKEALAEADLAANETTEDELRSEWGNEYRTNINKINGLLDTAPEGVRDDILGARLASGKPLGSDSNALKFLIDLALIQNPTTTLVPDGGNMADSIQDEILSLEGMMGNPSSEYRKGTKSEKLQARYRELISARDKVPQT